ncbi:MULTISPECIES: 3-isopropylmalate dehydratase small subunit [unclassified Sphingomonas]|uniref:3-isopropylmalate dehydratase small subunit n=1 Tax=unclassified Sphingomonas TaxID=196159 RepID=UPI0006F6F949|nr:MULTISPECIES: 3-isopropylmalate dehydratase small subunit [unclassified Sphingomonas]KQX23594.1 3-isopropylmalate dehydratase [Sphingomonas sp. Root1294]KQY68441.1 3-isopropylmalate dehydratase [Sphingomonas sp. Root50]KRB91399.1 3-isopropylmalate dehydratase [Sphingomonas sp. Root720]
MQPVDQIHGRAYPLGRDNIDTDIILPGRFLKTITRAGLGGVAFEVIRAEPGNALDDPAYAGAPILIAGENFGCGSSREHAVWAMMDMGIRAVVARGFSDIFAGNAFKNGLLTVVLDPDAVDHVLEQARAGAIDIQLGDQRVILPDGTSFAFAIDPFRKHCLLNGLDEIGLSLDLEDQIAAFERQMAENRKWLLVPA